METTKQQTTQPSAIECSVGLRHENNGMIVWIRSPRTGNTLSFTERVQSGLPAGVRSRIVQAVANGRHVASFTADELRQLVTLDRTAREALTPRRGGPSSGGSRFGGRGHW